MQKHKAKGPYEAFFKRLIDIAASALVLVLFCWLYLILAALVRIRMGSPVIFTQDRPGKDGKIFKLYKFRSMIDKRDENRSTSLDELPEMFNILKGDMSFIGPRPLLVKYLPHYNAHDARRHEVRPGLTGLAQVSGRNALTWKEKFEKDVEYVDNLTFRMDARIFLATVKQVVRRDGIEFQEGHQPVMEYFREVNGEKEDRT